MEREWDSFLDSPDAAALSRSEEQEMARALVALRDAANSRDGLAARQAANDVSKVMINVFDLFRPVVPADVGRLDYLERQVIIDAERGDWSAVSNDVAQVRTTFDRVKHGVAATGGTEEATNFEDSVAKQEALVLSNDATIKVEANVALELVEQTAP